MNITNILVDRATSVISSALCGGGGARQRLPHTHAQRQVKRRREPTAL